MVRSLMLRISTALVVALTAGVVLVASGPAATATQGQAVIAGQTNTATNTTVVQNTNISVPCTPSSYDGVLGCGNIGVVGSGNAGVFGSGGTTGVSGIGGTTGVLGFGNTFGVSGNSG